MDIIQCTVVSNIPGILLNYFKSEVKALVRRNSTSNRFPSFCTYQSRYYLKAISNQIKAVQSL